jgi:hypothetical protein
MVNGDWWMMNGESETAWEFTIHDSPVTICANAGATDV